MKAIRSALYELGWEAIRQTVGVLSKLSDKSIQTGVWTFVGRYVHHQVQRHIKEEMLWGSTSLMKEGWLRTKL